MVARTSRIYCDVSILVVVKCTEIVLWQFFCSNWFFCYLFWKWRWCWGIFLIFQYILQRSAPDKKKFLVISAWNYPCQRPGILDITRITANQPVKEKNKNSELQLILYDYFANNLHWRSALDTWHGAVNFPIKFKNWFSGKKFKWWYYTMYMEIYSFGHTTSIVID